MEELEEIQTLIEYYELSDGEIFGIQQVDPESGEVLDQIIMRRQLALEIAHDIIKMFGDPYETFPSTK